MRASTRGDLSDQAARMNGNEQFRDRVAELQAAPELEKQSEYIKRDGLWWPV